ncbi:MAG: class I tRNA ligase family protein [Candidatus Wildermuthbacteria bacterium]|nr:class I tRNA ligase family protein [Candidatus Wildermuthbacteria bacterium]
MEYNPQKIEEKWRKNWEKNKTFQVDLKKTKKPYYNLMMFPYPSAEGLHVGNVYAFTGSDIHGRFMRMRGFDVFEPIGFDAFGIHSENFAIKKGIHPKILIEKNIKHFREQLKSLGCLFDWKHEVDTTKPEYYKWTQWIFLQLFMAGLAYKKKAPVDWCPSCKTVLADEQVIQGKCERCNSEVVQKETEQWFFKITKYAEKLLKNLEKIDWSERTKLAQKNWIGKSEGAEIEFPLVVPASGSKKCLIIHGIAGNDQENWFPWLKKRLESQNWEVSVPNLPDTDHPVVEEWNKALAGEFKPESIIIGHSLGVPAALNLVQTVGKKVDKLILVAPVNSMQNWPALKKNEPELDWNAVKDFADIKFDWEKISSLANQIIFYYSDNDKYIPAPSVDYYKKNLPQAVFRLIRNKGHYNTSNGVQELPEVLEEFLPKVKVFTTRIDTIFSSTFLILAPEHPLVEKITTQEQKPEVEKYIIEATKKNEIERTEIEKEKTGVFTGAYAINPASLEKMPIWIADFVLAGYGTGAVFADAHDQRDFDMAKKYNIPLKVSIRPKDDVLWKKIKNLEVCYPEEGILVNSAQFNGLTSSEAREKITEWLEEKGSGKKTVNFHVRDWLISRQRYWGPPIPIIYCQKCGSAGSPQAVPVPEKDLPVLLPFVKNFRPEGTGQSPLASVKNFVNTKCPKCKSPAKRETDVSDTFLDSSWYYLRYPSTGSGQVPFDKTLTEKWLPVNTYIGGQEHAVLHLLYSRFITMALNDLGLINFEEPFIKFRAHGLITKGGAKMSKSKGNVVNPDDYFEKYGADTLRMYLMFLGPFSQGGDWSDSGIIGITRFLEKVWRLKSQTESRNSGTKVKMRTKSSSPVDRLTHKTIKKVTEDLESLSYNTAISALMILVNEMTKSPELQTTNYKLLLLMLSPFAPYITEEIWRELGGKDSIHNQRWPKYDEKLIKEKTITLIVQVNGRVRDKIEAGAEISEEEAKKLTFESEKVRSWVGEKEIKKVIFVPGKLINIVCAE